MKGIKEDIGIVEEIESKQSTEKNICEKTEEARIKDARASLQAKEIRIQETEKELAKKIKETDKKLQEIEEE